MIIMIEIWNNCPVAQVDTFQLVI
uniref:Uncharacterized protein n=1 Tax=Rhizophora mucronata TaxID=61149 RepID=A0A2P2N0G1_RHIMU